jgi:SNF2 family DNA or RNA helicase
VYDEVHALRSNGTKRWSAANRISKAMHYRIGCSATPLFNLGGEAWNILECLSPGFLGDKEQFRERWCGHSYAGKEPPLTNPDAFGEYLKSSGVMLRRTASEVGEKVHDCAIIHQVVDADPELFNRNTDRASEVARMILGQHDVRATGSNMMEFDSLLRQATGIAKTASVSAFVEMLIEQDESVVLFAWHQAVHDIYEEQLKKHYPVRYTGKESADQKAAAVNRFQNKDSRVILISLRAGEGLDGLQHVSNTAVVAELDWTWSVTVQNVGRIARDGQTRPCNAYFMVSEYGSDPIIAQTLGIKKNQLNGLLGERVKGPQRAVDTGQAIRSLARQYLDRNAKTSYLRA